MSGNLLFLTWYYMKAAVLMILLGNASSFLAGTKRRKWNMLSEELKGRDTWLVIGNGPSLKLEDIEAFHRLGVPTVASNKINILFKCTDWRPTLYTISDGLLLHKLPASHFKDFDRVLLPTKYVYMARGKNLLPWRHISNELGEESYLMKGEALDPVKGFFPGNTITCPNLQLAIWAGAKTIYLIGCDHSYANETIAYDAKGASKAPHQGESNHFDPNYRKAGEIVNQAPVAMMNRAYRLMQKIATQRGIRIVNISRKTALDVFELGTVKEALGAIQRDRK